MWPRQQQAYKARIIKYVVAALLLLCVLQVLSNIGKQTHHNAQLEELEKQIAELDEEAPVELLESQDVDKDRKLQLIAAWKDMNTFHQVLTDLLSNVDQMYSYVNFTLIPQRHDMELNLRAAGVNDEDMTFLRSKLDDIAKRMLTRGDEVRDDIESLKIKVKFIIEDLQYNLDNVVSSAFDYLVQFKKEFDQGYRNSRTFFELNMKNAGVYVRKALGNRKGKFAEAVREKLLEITREIINKRDAIELSKKSYENIKEQALVSLKSVIK